MWSTYTSPGWLLVGAVALFYWTSSFRIDASIELVEFRHVVETGEQGRRLKYRLARAAQRISTVLLVVAAIHAARYHG